MGLSACTGVLAGDDLAGAPLGEDGVPLSPYVNANGEIVDGVYVRADGVLVDRNGFVVKLDPLTGEPIIGADGKPVVDPTAPAPGEWVAAEFKKGVPISPTRRLTVSQYRLSVTEAFGADVMLPELPADESTTLHHHPDASPLGGYETYVGAATELGRQLAPALTARCNFVGDADGCTNREILPALQTLYRFDVGPAESSVISSVISEANSRTGDVEHAVALGVARALMDPAFLYRMESGNGIVSSDGSLGLTSFELANRLSFFSSDGPPSGALFDTAAASGELNQSQLESEAAAAFSGEEMRATTWAFMRKYLGLPSGDTETDPLKLAMMEETRRFVEYILVDEQAPFSDLMNADYSFINAALAEHYGVPAPVEDWALYKFPAGARRRGILTHGSFLSAHGREEPDRSWIFRGKAVYEHLFCGELPPPPDGVVDIEPKGSRTEDPGCRGCHVWMDPAGQFFDNFDKEGVLKNTFATPGTFKANSDVDVRFDDLPQFLDAIATSRALKHCFVKHWFAEALGRSLTTYDELSFELALSTLENTGSLRQTLTQIASTPSFQTYYPKPSDQICQ